MVVISIDKCVIAWYNDRERKLIMTITPIQKMIAQDSQKGLDNPANYSGIIVGGFNYFTSTAIYHYGDYRLWYKPTWSVWTVWKDKEFCFEFERNTSIVDMIARMDKL